MQSKRDCCSPFFYSTNENSISNSLSVDISIKYTAFCPPSWARMISFFISPVLFNIKSPIKIPSSVNNGNCIAMPFAKGWGWGAELNLQYVFEKLFVEEWGGGYPKERAVPEQRNAKILNEVKKVTHRDLLEILPNLDQDLVKGAVAGAQFKELFFANAKCDKIKDYIETLVG